MNSIRDRIKDLINKIRVILKGDFNQKNDYLPYVIVLTITLIIVIGGINLFIELTDTLTTDVLASYDHEITQYIISYREPGLTSYFRFVTEVGDLYGYLIVLGISFFISLVVFKSWKYVAQITFVGIISAVSNLVLKRFVDRARPEIEHLVSVETLSYPSGHAMSAMAFYGFLIYLFSRFNINKYLKIGVIMVLILLIFSIGISRIYLGVHFPSDIAGGFIAGFIWVIFCIMLFNLIDVYRWDPKT